ncbi:aldehyde ferredoxin oxidoreductase family protein [Haladaptatus sp. GCM10025707]|uniref:aldehyde ferredoxin oxidoreductase family protein n=1 Tax=unclassified Haladaptatus TaxID=2622732 RepID=UPI0023E86069|nr:aldehyde ferredoxin oxidoreductase C-terminal domain-containing protein [Haladaptatus sp. QDMS2]
MLHARGPLCTVDVGAQSITETNIDAILEQFIGGRGLATRLAHERTPFDADPLGPENRLYFTSGPMQTSQMSFTGRMNATAISPLTDGLLSSNAGGFVSRNFGATGYSALEIVGESDELVALHVTDEGVTFEEVSELKGATVSETDAYMKATHDLGEDQLVVAGPAGENQVRFACIMTSESRAFGRGGLGAVMGAKNVKAISFDGDSTPAIDIPATQMDIHREAATSDNIMKRQGTTSVTDLANEVGAFPTKYFAETSFEGAAGINGDAVESKKYKKGTCSACAFACKLPTKDEASGVETEGPEFETVMAFGSNALVDDIVDVMKSNELCDEYGLDTISCGDAVSAYLAANDEFGNVDLIHELVEKIAYREGDGDLLAEGIARFHEELGVENWTVKDMEFPAHDGRTLNGQGLSFAVANRGADHMYATFYSLEYPLVSPKDAFPPEGFEGKPKVLVEKENQMAINDSGIVCKFSRGSMTPERYELLFGADYDDLLAVGGRIVALERHFNNKRGFGRADDTLPYDLDGFDDALTEYYELRGWADDGTVTDDSVAEFAT